jgi:hypothetical protein
MTAPTVYMNQKGDWIASRAITFASGARGYEHVVLIKHTHSSDATRDRDEAERRAAEWSNQ